MRKILTILAVCLSLPTVAQQVYLSTQYVKVEGNTRTPFTATHTIDGVKQVDFSSDNKKMIINNEREIALDDVTYISFADDGQPFQKLMSPEMFENYKFDIPTTDIANIT